MVWVQIGDEHRGKTATLQVLRGYGVRKDMEKNVANLCKKCLRYQDFKAGKIVERPLGEVLHFESVGEVWHTSTFCTLVLVATLYERCWEAEISIPDGNRRLFEQFGSDGAGCDMHGEDRSKDAAVVVSGDQGFTCMGKRHGKEFQE